VSDSDTSGFEDLAGIYKALGNETRLQLLFQIETGEPISELADGISRSGLQKHVESLIDADLVYRPTESGPTYKLTQLGELFLEKIREEETRVDELLQQYRTQYEELREEEQETIDRMEDAGVDTKELEDKLKAEAWEQTEKE
jgi:DNA-binding transcriptional ArsR family regulator